eukprot:481607_1
MGIQSDTYIFSLEDCISWHTYHNGAWRTDQNLTVHQCITPKCVKKTQFYGGSGDNVLDVSNQDKIMGISSWGSFLNMEYSYHNALGNMSWKPSVVQSAVGSASNITSCKSFLLDADDYIHG